MKASKLQSSPWCVKWTSGTSYGMVSPAAWNAALRRTSTRMVPAPREARRSENEIAFMSVSVLEDQVCILMGAPIAFHPECPLVIYFASNPASRSLIAVLQPTWNPYAQYTTTSSDLDSSPIQSWSCSGSLHEIPSAISC